MTEPFGFVDISAERQRRKPRSAGLTMVVDGGVPLHQLEDGLAMAGAYADIGKIKVGSARLYPAGYLERKIAAYRDHAMDVFPGGQFLEYVLNAYGLNMSGAYFAEAVRLGFTAIEISDNVIPVADDDRRRLMAEAHAAGLKVFSEVGAKFGPTDTDDLIRQAQLSLDEGAELVLVEAAEFVREGAVVIDVLDTVTTALDMGRVMIELPGPWISTVTESLVEDVKKRLIASIGPNVNLGNVAFDMVLELEGARVGLGTDGPRRRAG